MRTMKLELLILCIVVSGIVGMTASPAEAATVLWQSPNTNIDLSLPYGSLEFENPLAGTEMIKEYAVKEWRDADYAFGVPLSWYDDWFVNDPVGIDGYANEIWMRWFGHSIWTSTTVPSTTVSIHLNGDQNDGLVEVIVDGILAARLDMGTPAPAVQNALIIVKNLANITHHIRVNDMGVGRNTGGDDVATMGAAALEKRIKWSQPPKPTVPENLYYGWNEVSDYNGTQIVADDWECTNDDPVTDIHWWGSFKNHHIVHPPMLLPSSFHITFWNDIPDPDPADPLTFSHPNEVVWEIDCSNFDSGFVGWDYDPITNCFETCYFFEQYLTEAEYFYQEPSPDGTPVIYWISIAAKYPDGSIVENPWGWKTRPRDPLSPAPDDAVIIRKPTMPHIGDKYQDGKPIYWPDPTRSWDMAFELTSIHIEPNTKWEQPPDTGLPGLHCHDYVNVQGNKEFITIADDWTCRGGEVTDLHWYGNYEEDASGTEMRGSGVRYFHLSIHNPLATVACIPQQTEIVGFDVPLGLGGITEIDTGMVNSENCKIYLYEYDLPTPFQQEIDQDYWLDITAFSVDPMDPPLWRWQEAARTTRPSPYGYLCGAVSRTAQPLPSIPGPWQTIMWAGDLESDMAFAITSTVIGENYPKWTQPPEPYEPQAYDGWNEYSVYNSTTHIAADDWYCDTDDPVTDIHWWGSFILWPCEEPPEMPESFHIAIWTDVPGTPGTSDFSHPNEVIWETVCNNFTYEFDGWDIEPNPLASPEACFKFEQDLPEEEWFYQKPGGNIYWISIAAKYPVGTSPLHPWGWKTRLRDLNSWAPDDAVRIKIPTNPVLGSQYIAGEPIFFPTPAESYDLAFELTTKEKPPKPPVPHLKWSQPPIEVDPNSETPVYSGWDEISYIDQIDTTRDPLVADDYRCLGSMPVTSIHWWGSHYGFVEPGTTPPLLPAGWKIGFWTNVPQSADIDYSYPEKMLWEVKVPADRVEVEEVGTDFYHHYYPKDVAYQYTLHLEPEEVFWQGDYLGDTQDDVFWLSIAAIYNPDIADIEHPWGWKTRPWSWMDDAVRFTYDGLVEPGIVLDPIDITPIIDPLYSKSFDVAFELDTDPNYIKWEQPFIGIRRWPHYEDVLSMGEVVPPQNVSKYIQPPDLPEGIDVDATNDGLASSAQILADDFPCTTTGPITDIHIWASWFNDEPPEGDPRNVEITLSIHEDIPDPDPGNPDTYSMPGPVRWWRTFRPGEFVVEQLPAYRQGYFIPCTGEWFPDNHYMAYRYDFYIDPGEAFIQKGTPDKPVIYWLDVQAKPLIPTQGARFGWKTSPEEFQDVAVFGVGQEPYDGPWKPMYHPEIQRRLEMAFEITTTTEPQLQIQSLVADDWMCKEETPVTAAVWWGSYIGYRYQACQDFTIVRPQKPDYFLLNVWTDVPAGDDPAVPYSHPGDIIWEHKAYNYDEVLVGFDKHPHAATASVVDASCASCGVEADPAEVAQIRADALAAAVDWPTGLQKTNMGTEEPVIFTGHVLSTSESGAASGSCGSILYAPSNPDDPNFRTAVSIACGGAIVDYFDARAGTPSVSLLSTYDCVMTWANYGYNDNIQYGDNLADYVDAGGKVILGQWCLPTAGNYLSGRIMTSAYCPVTASTYSTGSYNGDGTDCVHDGVTAYSTDNLDICTLLAGNMSDGTLMLPTGGSTLSVAWRPDRRVYYSAGNLGLSYSTGDWPQLTCNMCCCGVAREPVFRYSVRLPEDNWFLQEDVNNIYWFSVVSVYESGTDPLYDWGWTNHKHVFNDDAVAGSYDPAVGEWSWIDLYDQLGNTEDMSFILFTEPGCFPAAHPDYFEWLSVGKPDCWCYPRQCYGDACNDAQGRYNYWVGTNDLNVFVAAWNKSFADIEGLDVNGTPLICADIDHLPEGRYSYRVSANDLNIFVANWNIPNKPDPNCFDGY